jgi:O-antigen/teichoic acid export membrane protein
VVYAGSQWGLLVALARLASPGELGTFALALAVTAPIFLLGGLHLRASQATDAAGAFRFRDYLVVRLAGMALALAAVGALSAVAGYPAGTAPVLLAVGAAKAVEGLSDVHYGALQGAERMRPIALSLMARGGLSLAAFAAALSAGAGLPVAVAALGAVWVAVLVLHDVPAARAVLPAPAPGPDPGAQTRRSLVLTCLPLGLVMMLVSLRSNVPRYFVERWGGTAELGVFAALASLLVAGSLLVTALGQAATPRLAQLFHRGELGAFRTLVLRLLAAALGLGALGVAAAALAGGPLLRLLFGPHYAGRAQVLLLLMAAGVPAYAASVLGFALTAARRFAVQLPIFAGANLACAAGCLWLVPAHGLPGAAIAWGLSAVLESATIGALLASVLRRRAHQRRDP